MIQHSPDTLHARYLGPVLRYVRCRVENAEEAEDITADIFIAAFSSLHKVRNGSDPYPWLLRIARRKIADYLRKQAKKPVSLPPNLGGGTNPHAALEQDEAVAKIQEIVLGLSGDQREAILLQYLDRLSIEAIASVMRKTPAAVNSLLQRARANIYQAGRAYFLANEVTE